MNKIIRLMVMATLLTGVAFNAKALLITPDDPEAVLTGTETSNAAVLAILESFLADDPYLCDDLASLLKQNVGEVGDTGSFAGSYETTFSNSELDPEDATIEYVGGPVIDTDHTFLLVKDGDQDPAWYLYDISDWNGTETITLQGFWPQQGSISHIEIFGCGEGDTFEVPDSGLTSLMLGLAMLGLAVLGRRVTA